MAMSISNANVLFKDNNGNVGKVQTLTDNDIAKISSTITTVNTHSTTIQSLSETVAKNTASLNTISSSIDNLNLGNVVLLDTEQSITGTKTFKDDALKVNLSNIDNTAEITSEISGGIEFSDKSENTTGMVGSVIDTDLNVRTALKSVNGSNTAEISVSVDATGNGKAFAPSSVDGTTTSQIATVDAVNKVNSELSTSIESISSTVDNLSETISSGIGTNLARVGDIGKAGLWGFGVGIYPGTQEELNSLGLYPMEGYDNPYHRNYGNYMHKTAGVVVFIPKFYVRYGSSKSPNYSKYGKNAVDIASAYDFTDDATAQKSGYFLHRAFYDDGKEKDGFFIGKYEASARSANTDPMSYVAQGGMNNIQYWYFVKYARNIGYGWNVSTAFMNGALEVLMQAHGQASRFDANYKNVYYYNSNNAWYDSTGSANHPVRGYWNTSDNDTGEHAHNGQKCGVMGFKARWNFVLGITTPGSSSSDNSAYSSKSLYVFRRSTKLADITEGWDGSVGTNDAWGTASFLRNKNYQVETSCWDFVNYRGNYTEGWSDGKARWTCSGTETYSETNQDLFSVVPMSYSTYPTGSNLWDNSLSYFGLVANLGLIMHGQSVYSNSEGVFSRSFNDCRASGTSQSFRFAGFVD